MSPSKKACLLQLEQAIHNLKMRFPMGIIRLDDEVDEKLKRLIELRKDYGRLK